MDTPTSQDSTDFGTGPEVGPEFTPSEETKYAVADGRAAIGICRRLIDDWKDGISNAAIITHQLNGQPPRDPKGLTDRGRGWYPNISSKSLKNNCALVASAFAKHILKAQYLTAAELPPGWPQGATKSTIFRDSATRAIRQWENFPWLVNQFGGETATFGFCYLVYFDEWEWRPEYVSSTRGFVPIGTRVSDEDGPPMFAVAYDYRADQLLRLVQKDRKAKLDRWKGEAVAEAINRAAPKAEDTSEANRREHAERVAEATTGDTHEKAFRVVQTWHLFSADPDGTVSHHVVLADNASAAAKKVADESDDPAVLFECRAQFGSMHEVVTPMLFNPETGKIHSSRGVGHLLYDLALEFEKRFNDWVASLMLAVKIKVMVKDGVNPAECLLLVDDVTARLTNGSYQGNVAAVPTDPKPFQALLETFAAAAREAVGNLIPPIPLTPDDVKAAQIDAKLKEQQDLREHNLDMQLIQWAKAVRQMLRRMTKKGQDDEIAKDLLRELRKNGLTDEEIELHVRRTALTSLLEFTDYAANKRAAFAATKQGNPFYNQRQLEQTQATAAGGRAWAEAVMLPGDDATSAKLAARQQTIEIGAMNAGQTIEVLPMDDDFTHFQVMRPNLEMQLQQDAATGDFTLSTRKLVHAASHFVAMIAKKAMPKGYSGNKEKAFITKAEKTIKEGVLPEDGFADPEDVVSQAEEQMTQPAILPPSDMAPTDAGNVNEANIGELVK